MSVQTRYTVTGMTCDHCASAVKKELGQVPGVFDVQADFATGEVVVTSDAIIPIDEVRAAVDEAGYQLAP